MNSTVFVLVFCALQGFSLSFVGQLDGAAWTVEVFDFSTAVNAWVTAGTLTGSKYTPCTYMYAIQSPNHELFQRFAWERVVLHTKYNIGKST